MLQPTSWILILSLSELFAIHGNAGVDNVGETDSGAVFGLICIGKWLMAGEVLGLSSDSLYLLWNKCETARPLALFSVSSSPSDKSLPNPIRSRT